MIYVYYHDGYYDNGDVGLESFNTRDEAEEFVSVRARTHPRSDGKPRVLSESYTVIEGRELKMEAVEVVSQVRLC